MVSARPITELEGAILSEIHHRGHDTAFQVRRAFAASFSLEWKGSAGAVYPAVKRLERDGLIHAGPAEGGRNTRRLSLTADGVAALNAWAGDAGLATSVGVDPFRLRSGIWTLLPVEERRALFARLEAEIAASLAQLQGYAAATDPVERLRVELCVAVQQARRDQLRRWMDGGEM
ncbi:MAG: PadR family transcriptional regulator [Azospirillaceae bacterium]|nr:PadR family transcriptional regulator [Azospirillaceae bacterium]